MSAQGAGAVNDVTESASSQATEQHEPETQPEVSAADRLLQVASEQGLEIDDDDLPKDQPPPPEKPDAETETEPEKDLPAEQPEETETETEPKETDKDQDKDKPKGEEWPDSAKRRVAEESAAKRRYLKERDELQEQLDRVSAQLQQASAPRPTAQSPLADVYTDADLAKVERTYETMLEFAEKNRDGAENVLVGKESDGKEIRKDFTPQEIADLKVKADRMLRKEIPSRRAYLAERVKQDSIAAELYPEFKDPNSDYAKQAMTVLRNVPELETLIGPEVLIWIGHALKGRDIAITNANGKNGKGKKDDTVERVTKAAQTKVAPTPTKTTAVLDRKGVIADVASAEKKLEETGSEEDAVAYLAAQRAARKQGTVRQVTHVSD